MSWSQNVWVSKCLDLYAVEQYLDGTMSGWKNILLSKCLGVTKGVSKFLGVKISDAEMSENHMRVCYQKGYLVEVLQLRLFLLTPDSTCTSCLFLLP